MNFEREQTLSKIFDLSDLRRSGKTVALVANARRILVGKLERKRQMGSSKFR